MIDTRHETPVAFSADGEDLFGILTRPGGAANGVGVVLLTGGDFVPSTNRNRLYVRLARHLAEAGYHVLRFDYHGVGESTGHIRGYSSTEPFVSDLSAALGQLRREGLGEAVLVGNCFGSRTALAGATSLPGIRGVVLIAAPVRDFRSGQRLPTRLARDGGMGAYLLRGLRLDVLRRVFLPRYRRRYLSIITTWAKARRGQGQAGGGTDAAEDGPWLSARFVQQMAAVLRRQIPVLLIYGTDEDFYEEFRRAAGSQLREVLERAGALVQVVALDGTVHGFPTVEVQEAVLARVCAWIHETVPGRRAEERAPGRRDG